MSNDMPMEDRNIFQDWISGWRSRLKGILQSRGMLEADASDGWGDEPMRRPKFLPRRPLVAVSLILVLGCLLAWRGLHRVPSVPVAAMIARPHAKNHSTDAARTASAEAARPAAAGLPPAYSPLLNRSVFATGGAAAATADSTAASTPPAAFSLKGISQEDNRFTAFVEDAGGRVLKVRVGDPLARGRVADITLHGLAYQVGAKLARVEIGQGLEGQPALSAPIEPPAADAGHNASASQDVAVAHKRRRLPTGDGHASIASESR